MMYNSNSSTPEYNSTHQMSFESSANSIGKKEISLIKAFNEGIEQIKNDDMIKVMLNSPETKNFAFDRMKEIVDDSLKTWKSSTTKQLEIALNKEKNEKMSLKFEIENLLKNNNELQSKMAEESKEHFDALNNEVKELKKRVEELEEEKKEMEIMNCELEEKNKENEERVNFMEQEIERRLEEKSRSSREKINSLEDKITDLQQYKFKTELENTSRNKELSEKDTHISVLNKKIEEVEGFLEEAEKENKNLLSKIEESKKLCLDLEKEMKKIDYERNELISVKERKEKSHKEELELLNKRISEMQNTLQKKNKDKEYKEHIKILEKKFQEIKENSQMSIHKLEESEFENTQLKESLAATKKEVLSMSEKLSKIRQQNHHMELSVIESKDKVSELLMQNSGLIEDLSKTQQEVFNFFLLTFN